MVAVLLKMVDVCLYRLLRRTTPNLGRRGQGWILEDRRFEVYVSVRLCVVARLDK
jgi:hypothetical protein